MILLKRDDLFENEKFSRKGQIDFSGRDLPDALAKKIILCEYDLHSFKIEEDEINLHLNVFASLDYFDARTLDLLTLEVSFEEDIPFSSNFEKSTELDIDYFEDNLDLEELIFELILINVPLNYSENSNDLIKKEKDLDNTNPFKEIFNKK